MENWIDYKEFKQQERFMKTGELKEMEDKYYTPEIEEFHVGFEYEINYMEEPYWVKEALVTDAQVIVLPFIITKNCRVKHLDREDIEDLGWGNYKKAVDAWYEFIPEFSVQLFNISYRAFGLTHGSDGRVRIIGYEYSAEASDEEVLFCGLIKNKSELKKVLKQIGI
jgi:hypothetical protein